ncbi:MAG: beta-N-acetylhexosaminidase [Microbacterium sp.]
MNITAVPAPAAVRTTEERFRLDARTTVHADATVRDIADRLRQHLSASTGLPLASADGDAGTNVIRLRIDASLNREEYRLSVRGDAVTIVGGAPAGVFHGTQTLRQLLPPATLRRAPLSIRDDDALTIPGCEIVDAPAYRWRGLMLDTVRHFTEVREILRIIDLLALHHMNVLHLHLTDDQGWRLEVRGYPLLTEIGAWRPSTQVGRGEESGTPHGGYYTQDDIREIVAYAAARHITVVPEIESPGHARAALAAYPEFAVAGTAPEGVWTRWGISDDVFSVEEETIDFLCDVLDEVMDLFPSPYIGIGGDECPKTRWRDDPRTQERMRELGLDDEEQLQAWFVGRLEVHVRARGRRIFGWDEILEGGASGGFGAGTAVASWRGEIGARVAVKRGFDVVACPADQVYLDYRQSESDDEPIPTGIPLGWRDVYRFEPTPSGLTTEEADRVLGGQGNLWTEFIDSPQRIDYMLFPRLGALAEVLWTGARRRIDDFERRLPEYTDRLEALGVAYRRETGPRPWERRPGIPGSTRTREELAEHLARITASIADA